MKYSELLKQGVTFLTEAGINDAQFDAAVLLEHTFSISRTEYYMLCGDTADEKRCAEYMSNIRQRAKGKPLQYIIGEWSFMGLKFAVGEGVLIPRPETEELTELAFDILKDIETPTVFDLCAGSGCIGISIAERYKRAQVFSFEKSNEAFPYLLKNISLNKTENVKAINTDIFEAYKDITDKEKPDLIVSNPPYIETEEIASLQAEVLNEPLMALDGGSDGLDFYRLIAEKWLPLLNAGGAAVVECGETQSAKIAEIFSEYPRVRKTQITTDLQGKERFVTAFLY